MDITILPYQSQYQPYFEKLNKKWIERYFVLEPIDQWVLEKPEEAILKAGGSIFFAAYNQQIIGTAALKWIDTQVMELTKMAVAEEFQGMGVGKLLCSTAIEEAKEMGAKTLVLYTHSLLTTAIGIYRKLGFMEVPVEPGKYDRANVKMQIIL